MQRFPTLIQEFPSFGVCDYFPCTTISQLLYIYTLLKCMFSENRPSGEEVNEGLMSSNSHHCRNSFMSAHRDLKGTVGQAEVSTTNTRPERISSPCLPGRWPRRPGPGGCTARCWSPRRHCCPSGRRSPTCPAGSRPPWRQEYRSAAQCGGTPAPWSETRRPEWC